MGAANAKRDMERYRAGYPGQRDDPRMTDNIRFYRNKLSSSPNGDYIDRIHKNWFGSYAKLEAHHGYIQWLFPIREHGMNGAAQPLQVHEARSIVGDPECMERVFKSYELMLDFYGFRLANRESGELVRSDNCHDRFDNLNYHGHNYLRITRILKFLGEVELEHLKFPFLATMVHEVYEEKALRNCARSLEQYWSETLKDREQRRQLHDLIRIHNPDHSGCVEEDGDGARTSPPGTPPR